MPHKLSQNQFHALHYTALALRDDWKHNRPGSTWQHELGIQPGQDHILPHADDFRHALKALINFADRKADDGTHIMRTPKYYVHDGKHWTETRTTDSDTGPPCDQHGTDYGTKHACRACLSEIKAGERPESMLGEHYDPDTPPGTPA